MAVEVGKRVPDVTLVSSERKAVKLSEFLGKPTVLAFFPGAFTGVCTKELCTFRDGMAKFNEMKAQVLAVSVDSPFAQKAFAEQNKLNFTLLSDFRREAVQRATIQEGNGCLADRISIVDWLRQGQGAGMGAEIAVADLHRHRPPAVSFVLEIAHDVCGQR